MCDMSKVLLKIDFSFTKSFYLEIRSLKMEVSIAPTSRLSNADML